jgi:OOP family OmpA-OmpF porin
MPEERTPAETGPEKPGPLRGTAFLLRRWFLPGLIVSTVLAVLAIGIQLSSIEDDLQDRVAARMEQAGLEWVTVETDGREVTLTGTAPTEVQRLEARETAADIWGVAGIRDETELIPAIVPFAWAAEKDGSIVILTGYLPTAEIHESVRGLVSAIMPEAIIEDQTELARGAPPDFRFGVEFGLRVLANLVSGHVGLSGYEITAEGVAIDGLRYESAIGIAESGLPPGFIVAGNNIRPPMVSPYVWSVTISESVTVLSGVVPSRRVSGALEAEAISILGGTLIENRVELASGQPETFQLMANQMLRLAGLLGSGELILTDSNLTISGRALSPAAYDEILALLAAPQPAGLTIGFQEITPSVAEAYVLEVFRSVNGVELIGFMPSEEARSEVLAEAFALFGEQQTEDRLQIADGAPRMDWIGAAKFAIGQVAGLSGGSARISDLAYTLTGAAATSESYEALRTQLAGILPASLVLNNALLTAPVASPYRYTAAVGPESVTLTGVIPSPELRDVFMAEAALRFVGVPIADETRVASGNPVGFELAVLAGLQAISRLEAGRFELVDLTVEIAGVAPYGGAIVRIEEQFAAAVPGGFARTTVLTVTPAQASVSADICQQLLVDDLGEGGIKFSEGSAAIAPESEGRLDRLVAILSRCPNAGVEIGGHTDSGGTTARNQALSQIRAEAVIVYLQQAGIAAEQLAAVGYGETDPIADNDTEEGRAQNRRIEFTIVGP